MVAGCQLCSQGEGGLRADCRDAFVDFKNFPRKCVDKVNPNLAANPPTEVSGIYGRIFDGQTPIQERLYLRRRRHAVLESRRLQRRLVPRAELAEHCRSHQPLLHLGQQGTSDYGCSCSYDPNRDVPSTYDWSLGTNLD